MVSVNFQLVMNEKSPRRENLRPTNGVGIVFLNSDTSTIPIGCNDLTANDLIPGPPATSSRGAADTTAGRIYFSTPSAHVRVPVGDLVSPPHFCSHYTTDDCYHFFKNHILLINHHHF